MKTEKQRSIVELLREGGFKATPRRIALLSFLKKQEKPLTVKEIADSFSDSMDQVSIYRALEAFADKRIVREVDMRHPHKHYEMVLGREHHHHIICKACGKVEDVEYCETEGLEYRVLKSSIMFSTIESHALEFFGLCHQCKKHS